MSNILIAKGLTKTVAGSGQKLLNQVDLSVDAGQKVLISGPSGSGKTTLLHCLSGLDSYDAGSVDLLGHRLGESSQKKIRQLRLQKIGFIFQFHHLLDGLTVADNILMPLKLNRKSGEDSLYQLCDQLCLDRKLLGQSINVLSGGERQRVAAARALIHQPEILFADEPTGCLDQKNAQLFWDILQELNSNGLTIVLVTHEVGLLDFADKHYHIVDGAIAD